MGTWSCEPFGNDGALDWAQELEGRMDFAFVEKTLALALDEDGDLLEAGLAEEAVAAAETVARALGRGTQTDGYVEGVDAWLRTLSVKPDARIVEIARRVVERVLGSDSELRELWEESSEYAEWQKSMRRLLSALNG